MLGNIKTWLGGLSLVGKIVAYSSAAVIGGTILTATADTGSNTTPPPTTTQTAPAPQSKPEPKKEVKTEYKKVDVSFVKTTVDDSTLASGLTNIKTAGVNGTKTQTYEVTYLDGVEKSRELVNEGVTTAPINEVTAIGTYVKPKSSCDPAYSPCVPLVSYDLDCADIGFSVIVDGYDKHGFDRDNDGYGCESY